MTTPLAGHPDWQNEVIWRSSLIFRNSFLLSPQSNGLIVTNSIVNFAGISISLTNMNGYGEAVVNYSDAGGFDTFAVPHKFVFGPFNVNVRLPADGVFFQLVIDNPSTTNTLTGDIEVRGTNNVDSHPRYYSPDCFCSIAVQNVNNGVSITSNMPGLMPGPATLYANSGVPGGGTFAVVGLYNNDGTVGDIIAEIDPIPFTEVSTVWLPDRPCFLKVGNQSGAATTLGGALYPTGGLW